MYSVLKIILVFLNITFAIEPETESIHKMNLNSPENQDILKNQYDERNGFIGTKDSSKIKRIHKFTKNANVPDDSKSNKKQKDFIAASKELLKKNNEFIESIEKNLNSEKKLVDSIDSKKVKHEPAEIHSNIKQPPVSANDSENKKFNNFAPPLPIAERSILKNDSPMRKISDILFKSTIVTKSDILTKEDAATMIENNNKIKSIIGQLQKIQDSNLTLLKKFQENSMIEENTLPKDKPKDLIKYQVIEVTDNKNNKN